MRFLSALIYLFLIGLLIVCTNNCLLGQEQAIRKVKASDGTYAKYVLVRWKSIGSVSGFDIYRSRDNHVRNASLIKTIDNSWLMDYAVQPGVKYHYWVTTSQAGKSPSDDGYAAKLDKVAIDNLESANEQLIIEDPARFDANPYLEPLINDTRSIEFNIELDTPSINQEFLPSLDLMIEFKGTLEELPEERLLLHIYSNNKEEFLEDLTLVKTALQPTQVQGATTYNFAVNIPFPYPSGLYYYSIQLEESEEPIKIGKILLKE